MTASTDQRNSPRRFAFDISHLPATTRRARYKHPGAMLVIIALIWGSYQFVGKAFIPGVSRSMGADPFTVLLIFILLFVGVCLLVWRQTITVDRDFVEVAVRTLRGTKEWREQLSNYTGVLRRTVRGKNATFYLIDLYHEDESKTVNLFIDVVDGDVREKWETYSRVLELPALEQGQGGVLRREAEDLDKSVGELIKEGTVDVDFDLLEHKAEGLAVDFEGDTVVITRTGPERPWWGMLVSIAFPLLFVAVAALIGTEVPWYARIALGGAGACFAIRIGVPMVRDIVSRQKLRVGPRILEVGTVTSRGEKMGKQIPIGEIESVTIAGEYRYRSTGVSRYGSPAVIIAGDRETLEFGANLPRPSLDFVMNTVLAMIAEANRHGRR